MGVASTIVGANKYCYLFRAPCWARGRLIARHSAVAEWGTQIRLQPSRSICPTALWFVTDAESAGQRDDQVMPCLSVNVLGSRYARMWPRRLEQHRRTPAAVFAAAALCFGVTSVLTASASASVWSMRSVPLPQGVKTGELDGVSCPSPSFCIGVGLVNNVPGGNDELIRPLAERWNGAKWSIMGTPELSGASRSGRLCTAQTPCAFEQLASVSCTSRMFCMAVGWFAGPAPNYDSFALAERWNGATWSIAPVPRSLSGQLVSVSCTSRTFCIAAGGISPDDWSRWNGSTWAAPRKRSLGALLTADPTRVSCASSRSCAAISTASYASDSYGTYGSAAQAVNWNGVRWTDAGSPQPGVADTQLNDVSCRSGTTCMAVGTYDRGAACGFADSPGPCIAFPLLERRMGATWRLLPIPRGSPDRALDAVSCASATACTAVGDGHFCDQKGCAEYYSGFAMQLTGARWSIQRLPRLDSGALKSDSCTSTSCTAVGSFIASNGQTIPLVETTALPPKGKG